MTPEEQNKTIAEWLGWRDVYGQGILVDYMWAPGHISKVQAHWKRGDDLAVKLPDYCNDLNAIHEAEKTLKLPQWVDYCKTLEGITRRDGDKTMPNWQQSSPSMVIDMFLIHATAQQKSETLLRTVGKWKGQP